MKKKTMCLQLKKSYSSVLNFLLTIILSFLLFEDTSFAATKTWANGAAGGPWTTGANWVGGVAPVANDDVVINPTATFTITVVPTLTVNSLIIGGTAGSSVTLQSAGSTLTIANGALATDFSVASGVTLRVNNSFSITATAASSVGTVSGTLTISGVGNFSTTAAITTFVSGSTYNYARNGCAGCLISTATYNSGSTINVTGVTGATVILPGTVGGDVIWNCTGQTGQFIFFNTTPATFSGTVTVTSTGTGLIIVAAGAARTLNIGGDLVVNGGNFTISGATAAQILNVTGDIKLSTGTFAFGTGSSSGDATGSVTGNVTISGGTFDMTSGSGTKSLSVAKDWTNNGGTVNIGPTSTVTFNGTTNAQTIGGTASTTFNNLTINNTFGTSPQITLGNNITANNNLTMTSGIYNLNTYTLTLGSSGVASTLSRAAGTWMYGGTFRRFWLAATAISSTVAPLYGLFPMGASEASSYRPLEINTTANPTTGGSFTVNHIATAGSLDLSPFTPDGAANIERIVNAQFVTAISGVVGGTYNIDATMTGLLAGTLSDIRLAIYTGGTTAGVVGTHAGATGSAPNPTAKRTEITTITDFNNDFRISSSNAVATPLPVEWLNFDAVLNENIVELSWITASEINNDYFTIERSADAINFDSLFVTDAAGTSSMQNFYTGTDSDPLPGKSYYRLKQTDYDGTEEYSKIISVKINQGEENFQISISPNPFSAIAFVRIENIINLMNYQFEIYNLFGKEMNVEMLRSPDEFAIFSGNLPGGIYFLQVSAPSEQIKSGKVTTQKKIIVIK